MSKNLKAKAYDLIKEKIINCQYQPGSLISEEMLQNDISASRTPIREALGKLEQENLLSVMPKKGIRISPISLNEMNMIFEVRLLIEPYSLLNYGYMLQEEKLLSLYQSVEKCSDAMDIREMFALDDELHNYLNSVVPNLYIRRQFDIISAQNRRYRILTGEQLRGRVIASMKEHAAVLKSCLKKEWENAAENMKEHLLISKNSSFEFLLKNNVLFEKAE